MFPYCLQYRYLVYLPYMEDPWPMSQIQSTFKGRAEKYLPTKNASFFYLS